MPNPPKINISTQLSVLKWISTKFCFFCQSVVYFIISLFNRTLHYLSFPSFCKDWFIASKIGIDASSDFMKGRACSCPLLSTTSFSLGTNQKLHTFCSISNFTLRLKFQIFRNFFIFCFQGNKRKWKHPFGARQSNFWEGGKTFLSTLYFRSSPILTLLGERFWDKN